MRVCIIHRYPLSEALMTNPSLIDFLNILNENKIKVMYLSYKEKRRKESDVFRKKNITFIELPFFLRRSNHFDKYFKTFLFIILTPYMGFLLKKRGRIELIYCDDSVPYYGYFIKKFISYSTVIIRLGDLQTGYLFLKKTKLHYLIFKILHTFEIHTWRIVDGIIPISKAFENYLMNKQINAKKIRTVLECVDTNYFKPKDNSSVIRKKYGLDESNLIVMFHGVIEPLKGMEIILEHFAKVSNYFPNLRLMVIGEGSQLKKLKKKSESLNIIDKVIWTGWIPYSKIVDYINACDIGLPMRSDNMANNFVVTMAMLQYLACKKPVLAPRLEATAQLVEEEQVGFLFTHYNFREFKLGLEKLIKDNNLRKEIGNRGVEVVKRKFSKEKIAHQLYKAIISIYESVGYRGTGTYRF